MTDETTEEATAEEIALDPAAQDATTEEAMIVVMTDVTTAEMTVAVVMTGTAETIETGATSATETMTEDVAIEVLDTTRSILGSRHQARLMIQFCRSNRFMLSISQT